MNSKMVDLMQQLQDEAVNEVENSVRFHAETRDDMAALLEQLNNKIADDEARFASMLEQIGAIRDEVLAARKSSGEFYGKVREWLQDQIVGMERRIAADAGERQPPARSEVKSVGKVPAAEVKALETYRARPSGQVADDTVAAAAVN